MTGAEFIGLIVCGIAILAERLYWTRYVRKRDIEWAVLLASRLADRNREWLHLIDQANRSGRPIVVPGIHSPDGPYR